MKDRLIHMDYFKENSERMVECVKKVQALMHEYGYPDFADAVAQAAFQARDEIEDIYAPAADAWGYLANRYAMLEFSNLISPIEMRMKSIEISRGALRNAVKQVL